MIAIEKKEKILQKRKIKSHRRSDFINSQPKEIREAYEIEFDIALDKDDIVWYQKRFMFFVWSIICPIITALIMKIPEIDKSGPILAPLAIIICLGNLFSLLALTETIGYEAESKTKNRERTEARRIAWNIFNEERGFRKGSEASLEQVEVMETAGFQKAIEDYKRSGVRANSVALRKTKKRMQQLEENRRYAREALERDKAREINTKEREISRKEESERIASLRKEIFEKV